MFFKFFGLINGYQYAVKKAVLSKALHSRVYFLNTRTADKG